MKGFFKSRLVLTLVTLILLAGTIAVSLAGLTHSRAAVAASTPSGERIHGQSVLEPVYDDTTGNVNFHADYLWSMTERFKFRFGTDLFNIANTKRILLFNQLDSLQFGVPNADFLKPTVQTIGLNADGIQSPFNARIFARLEF